jgi:hypothetical protein
MIVCEYIVDNICIVGTSIKQDRRRRCWMWSMMKSTRRHLDLRKIIETLRRSSSFFCCCVCMYMYYTRESLSCVYTYVSGRKSSRTSHRSPDYRTLFQKFPPRSARRQQPRGYISRTHTHTHTQRIDSIKHLQHSFALPICSCNRYAIDRLNIVNCAPILKS